MAGTTSIMETLVGTTYVGMPFAAGTASAEGTASVGTTLEGTASAARALVGALVRSSWQG